MNGKRMKKIEKLFKEYSESHRNDTNKAIHWVCVPLIFWSILGFLSLIPSPHFYIQHFGFISVVSLSAIIIVTIYYASLSWRIALIMFFVMSVMEFFVSEVNQTMGRNSWMIFLTVFVLAWLGQFYGHKIEGKKPSFLKDLQFLLIGPAWLLHFVLKKAAIKY